LSHETHKIVSEIDSSWSGTYKLFSEVITGFVGYFF